MIHYNSPLMYQNDSKFIKVGVNSIRRMHVLLNAGGFLFVHKDSSGFVFKEDEVAAASDGDNLLPVMVVKLRESGIENYKQAHGLRIREHLADESVAKTWYFNYIDQVAPIVSDKDHLHGGYLLWKHFLKQAALGDSHTISVLQQSTGKVLQENATIDSITESDLWSQHPNHDLKDIVLLMKSNGS